MNRRRILVRPWQLLAILVFGAALGGIGALSASLWLAAFAPVVASN